MLAVAVYFVLPSILLILGLPIFLVLLVTCLVAVLFVADVPTEAIQTYLFGGLDNLPLLAVPFFVLAGEIMAQGGIARRVVVWVVNNANLVLSCFPWTLPPQVSGQPGRNTGRGHPGQLERFPPGQHRRTNAIKPRKSNVSRSLHR